MKNIVRQLVGLTFLVLLAANVYVFMNGVQLSDKVHYYESEVSKLRNENISLEKTVYKFDSITYAASIAAELEYAEADEKMYVTKPGYAYNR